MASTSNHACPECGGFHSGECAEELYPEDLPRKKVRNPVVIKKWFRILRRGYTAGAFDPTYTVTWTGELGRERRPWIRVTLNEFQFVFWLRVQFRGHKVFEVSQTQEWEPKDRKWMFLEWLFEQFEVRYEDYEHSLPEDPYGSISDWE